MVLAANTSRGLFEGLVLPVPTTLTSCTTQSPGELESLAMSNRIWRSEPLRPATKRWGRPISAV